MDTFLQWTGHFAGSVAYAFFEFATQDFGSHMLILFCAHIVVKRAAVFRHRQPKFDHLMKKLEGLAEEEFEDAEKPMEHEFEKELHRL